MKRNQITHYYHYKNQFALNEFEEIIYDIKLIYSLSQLSILRYESNENIIEALQKSLMICNLVGENSKRHFKQIFVFDDCQGHMHIDWLMSKKGINLMIMQIKTIDKNSARWLWEIADVQL